MKDNADITVPGADEEQATSLMEIPSPSPGSNGHEQTSQQLSVPAADNGLADEQRSNMTRNQLQVWLAQKLYPDTLAYHVAGSWTIRGPINLEHLHQTFQTAINSSDALRSVFVEEEGIPVRRVLEPFSFRSEVVDFSSDPRPRPRLQGWAQKRARAPFDLSKRLFDSVFVRLSDQELVWYFNAHHLICDGWSVALLGRICSEFYRRSMNGELQTSETLSQFGDFVRREREFLESSTCRKNEAYWKQTLNGDDEPLSFYGKSSLNLNTEVLRIPVDLGPQRTDAFSRAAALPVFASSTRDRSLLNVFLTLLAVYLHKVCGRDHFTIGIPFHNRRSKEAKETIGFFSEVMPLRVDIDDNESYESLAQKLKKQVFEMIRHGPFTASYPKSKKPYEVIINLHVSVFQDFNGVPTRAEWIDIGHGLDTLAVQVHSFNPGSNLLLDFDFRREVFTEEQGQSAVGHFLFLLDKLVQDPGALLSEISLLTDGERQKVLVAWNDTAADYPREKSVIQLFEEQAARSPGATALVFEDQELTYQELNDRASQLAERLRAAGVGPESFVGICMDRSPEMIAGVLGILKAGGAYVPLDPAYPPERLAFMLKETKAPVLLTQSWLLKHLPKHGGQVLCLDKTLPDAPRAGRTQKPGPDSPVYVIYTSGSTGTPKGVVMCQRALVNLLKWQHDGSGLPGKARTLQFSSLSFDVSFQEIFSTLGYGGTLVLIREEVRWDAQRLLAFLRDQKIERLFLPCVALQNLAEAARDADFLPDSLIQIITAGEQLQITPGLSALIKRLGNCVLQNQYGPTESHVVTSFTLQGPPENWPALPPIGRPIHNTQIYLLDRDRQPVPEGVPAELYIGGTCLALGYLHRPDLTAEKFVPDPFSGKSSAPASAKRSEDGRLYRTGDVARWLPDGNIEFLGRIDHQVKIRGFRIELGEVEAALVRHANLKDAVVTAHQDPSGSKRLVGYVIPRPGDTVDARSLRAALKQKLPEYMVPSAFVALEAFPLTPSGKVDRKSLAPPDQIACGQSRTRAVVPRNETERKLVEIWQEVLGLPTVSVQDNFFDLGGYSLAAIKVFSLIKTRLNRELPLSIIFKAPTIEQLAQLLIPGNEPPSWSCLVPIQPEGTRTPIFWVHTLGGGGGGGLFRYKKLAELLGHNQPSYGIQAPSEPFTSIETMAANYLKAVKTLQPYGPYYLVGYCFGGNVAYEMAQQLIDQGETVAYLSILDAGAFPPTHRPSYPGNLSTVKNFLINFYYWLLDLAQQTPGQQWVRFKKTFQRLKKLWNVRGVSFVSNMPELDEVINVADYPQDFRRHADAHWRAFLNYRPRPYPGHINVFRVRKQGLLDFEPSLGWSLLAGGKLAVWITPGSHDTIFDEPHVGKLAKHMKASLEKARTSVAAKKNGCLAAVGS